MITRIEASRYRCFERLPLDLARYQVLVGRNGAGKSTLIDIPACWVKYSKLEALKNLFLATEKGSRHEHLPPRILVFSGKGDWFSFAIEVRLPDFLVAQLERKNIEHLTKREQSALQKEPGRAFGALRYEIGFRIADEAIGISHEYLFSAAQGAPAPAGVSRGTMGRN